jgi:hypothetical protein
VDKTELVKVLKRYDASTEPGEFTVGNNVRLYAALFYRFLSEMPYGTAKARTGDPFRWIENRVNSMLEAQ